MSSPPRGPDDRFATAPRSESLVHPYKRTGVNQGPPEMRNLHLYGMADLDISRVDSPNIDVPADQTTFLPHVQGTFPNNASSAFALCEFKMWVSACLVGEVRPKEWEVPLPSEKQVIDLQRNFQIFLRHVMNPSSGLMKKEALTRSAAIMLQFIWCTLRVNYDDDFTWFGQVFDVVREPVARCDKFGGLHYFDPAGNCVSVPRRGHQGFTNAGFPHLAFSPHFSTVLKNPHSPDPVPGASGSAPPPGQSSASDDKALSPIGKIDELNASGGASAPPVDESKLNDDGDLITDAAQQAAAAAAPVASGGTDVNKDYSNVFTKGNAFPYRMGAAAANSCSGVAGEFLTSFGGVQRDIDLIRYVNNTGKSSSSSGTKFPKHDSSAASSSK
eukprot:g16096.t1